MNKILKYISKITVLSALAVILFTGCNDKSEGGDLPWEYRDSYLTGFYYMNDDLRGVQEDLTGKYFGIWTDSPVYKRNTTLFAKYKEYYNDTFYNRETWHLFNYAYCNEFIRFDVVSDKDFGSEHPAGTSLADITRIVSMSPYKYIKSGYVDEFKWLLGDAPEDYYWNEEDDRPTIFGDSGYHPVNKLLSELAPEDMILLDKIWFVFAKEPEVKGTHKLTLIVEDKEREMSCDFDFVFEE